MRFLYLVSLLLLIVTRVQAAGVAVVAPKDGDNAKFGQQLNDGVKIAVDTINEAGGLLGEKLELIYMDDVCSESALHGDVQALNISKDSGINLVIGPYCTDMLFPSMMKGSSAVRIMPQPLNNQWYNYNHTGLYKIGGRISEQAKTFFEVYKDKWIDKNLAVVYSQDNDATYETASELQSIFMANNLANRVNLYDINAYNNKMKKMAKEIVRDNKVAYILGRKSQIAEIAQKLQEKDENIIIIVDEYMATAHFFKEMGNFADGVYLLRINNQKSNANFTKELVELRIKGREPRGIGVMGYAAVMMWRDMVKKAQSFDAAAIDAIAGQQSWSLPWGKVKFQHGRTLTNGGWNMYLFEDGEYTQVN